jgi:hypothetical protein
VIVQDSGTLLFGGWGGGGGGGDCVGNKNPFAGSSPTQEVWDLGT